MSDASNAGGRSTAAESALIARARAAEPAAWTEIYTLYHAFIYRYVRARVFEEATAEDLTSATFLAALHGIRSYRERGRPFLAWLYSIARHKVADHQRHAVYQRGIIARLLPWRDRETPAIADAPAEVDYGTDAGDPGAQVEQLDLRRAVALLPEAQREVVILRHFTGLSTPEIAAAMGKKPSAVYSLEARALASLREKLAGMENISTATDENPSPRTIYKQKGPMANRS